MRRRKILSSTLRTLHPRYLQGLVLTVSLLVLPGSLLSEEHHARTRTYDVIHYTLNVIPDEHARTITGNVTITFVPLRENFTTLVLDAAELSIAKATISAGVPLKFNIEPEKEKLAIELDKPYSLHDTVSVTIFYSAKPRKGLYFIQPDSAYPHKPWQVWSQGEMEDNHYWFPCYDYPNDKATSEVSITVPDTQYALSNGRLLRITEHPSERKRTFHWVQDKPISSYLISVAAGDYVILKDSCMGKPVDYLVYRTNAADALRSFRKTPDMIRFFSDKIGYEYPWDKYDQVIVADFIYGGMENATATTLTDGTIHDARAALDVSSDGLVAHELAHQWWGDLLTCRSWAHTWLNEGFATYFAALYAEHDQGEDLFQLQLKNIMDGVIAADAGKNRRPIVWRGYSDPTEIFDVHSYQKGASVLHMLRFLLGDELFWKALNYYAHKNAFRNVETNDLKIAIEEATGENLYWFFEEWLFRAGYPEYEVRKRWDPSEKKLHLLVKQIQKVDEQTPLFIMPIDIEIATEAGTSVHRILVSKAEEEFVFDCAAKPLNVIFDKGGWILKKLTFEKPKSEWLYQLAHGTAIERLDAIHALRKYFALHREEKDVLDALRSSAENDLLPLLRAEAINALAQFPLSSDEKMMLLRLARDQSAQVRRAAMAALSNCKGDDVIETLRSAFAHDSSYFVAAEAMKSLAKIDTTHAFEILSQGLARDSHQDVIRSAALQGLAELHDTRVLPIIESYTAYGKPNNLRTLAVHLLAVEGAGNEKIFEHLVSLLHDPYIWTRTSAMEALAMLKDKRAIAPLEQAEKDELDGRAKTAARNAISLIKESTQSSR